jgi:hypothetical protein
MLLERVHSHPPPHLQLPPLLRRDSGTATSVAERGEDTRTPEGGKKTALVMMLGGQDNNLTPLGRFQVDVYALQQGSGDASREVNDRALRQRGQMAENSTTSCSSINVVHAHTAAETIRPSCIHTNPQPCTSRVSNRGACRLRTHDAGGFELIMRARTGRGKCSARAACVNTMHR